MHARLPTPKLKHAEHEHTHTHTHTQQHLGLAFNDGEVLEVTDDFLVSAVPCDACTQQIISHAQWQLCQDHPGALNT